MAEMGSSPTVARRMAVAEVDSASLDSWDWDVFRHTHEQLVPHVVIMFMRLGLTQHEVCTRAGRSTRCLSTQSCSLAIKHRMIFCEGPDASACGWHSWRNFVAAYTTAMDMERQTCTLESYCN